MRALALANARYWPSVAPVVASELARWQRSAERIADPALRKLAVAKLDEERFNAEVAATLATLAPCRARPAATRAIVALELLFDYLDGRTERPSEDPLGEGRRLFAVFTGALDAGHSARKPIPRVGAGSGVDMADAASTPDAVYLEALGACAREQLLTLPAARAVAGVAQASAERCAQAQTLLHAGATLGDGPLREWAREQARGSGLEWREYAGGCASSVLAVHALIAAAADACTSAVQAQRIDAAYLAIGGVITMLDSLVDHRADTTLGQAGFIRLYDSREQLAQRLCALTREALARAREAPNGDHHAMTLAGVIAYYTTHPGARETHARTIVKSVRRELAPTIWPTLAVMQGWRAAKWARARMRSTTTGPVVE